jgi:hypothetical protein
MKRKQEWFEMRERRARSFDRSAWTPLRAVRRQESAGKRFAENHEEEFFGASSAVFPVSSRLEVERTIGWGNLSLMHDHAPYAQDDEYTPADRFVRGDLQGTYLVLSQEGNRVEHGDWLLHPDLILGLRLKREGDVWLAMDEGYIQVVRMTRDEKGSPNLLEIRTSHLKDLLAARREFLCISTYSSREEISDDASTIDWPENTLTEEWDQQNRWRGTVTEITEDGHPFGSSMAIFHVGRKNFDREQDVPEVGINDDFESNQYTRTFDKGRKLYRVWGELWKVDFIEPGEASPRVRRDETASLVYFYTDASGKRESAEELDRKGRWLWFKPDVINKALEFRGSFLEWYTADTGRISMGPDGGVPFGVNDLGLINVYAKDISFSSLWQQQLWAGFNVVPDGGVSRELLMSQAEGEPASTQAPEAFLESGIRSLNEATKQKFGFEVIRSHRDNQRLLRLSHRFRAISESGLHTLAKDLTRLIVDNIDIENLQKITPPPKGQKRGSLKSLEAVLGSITSPDFGYRLLGPFFGIYELRLADAHLPSSEIARAYKLVGIDTTKPWVTQGKQMLERIVSLLHIFADIISQSAGGPPV